MKNPTLALIGAACAALRVHLIGANEELREFLQSGILFLGLV